MFFNVISREFEINPLINAVIKIIFDSISIEYTKKNIYS